MSQTGEIADMDGAGTKGGLTAEALQRYLATLAEDRDASAERTEGILARFFKVAIVMVCLNVVIAGANVAMILVRPRVVTNAPPAPTSMPAGTEPFTGPPSAPPVVSPPACAAEPPAPSTLETAAPPSSAVSTKPAAPLKPALAPTQPEKKVPLLGPLPVPKAAATGAAMLAKRPTRPAGRLGLVKPFLSDEDVDQDGDDRPMGPPERW
jgi:hypothetical protein